MSRRENGGGFDIDGPFMHVLETILNLWVLNLLTIIVSIPIVTAGAALTAMNHQLYLMSKGHEGYVVRGFFKDFKSNFKTSTIPWLIMLVVGVVLWIDLRIFADGAAYGSWFKFGIYGITVLYLFVFVYLFPILARYETTMKMAFKNALFMAVYGVFKTLLMVALVVAPWVLAYLAENFIIVDLFFGLTLPAFANVYLYTKTFEAFEKNQEQARAKEEEAAQTQQVPEDENIKL